LLTSFSVSRYQIPLH